MSFVNERTVKAVRKARQCCACHKQVEIGHPAVTWAGLTDGDFDAVTYHPECRAAEIEMNKLYDTGYPDEWMGLQDIETEDRVWLLAEHPVVAARMGIE